ncbi:hypothetical protein N7478_003865 [Penicillium angulare]|uniref:uncharacterized protein n=1 Tax=Penicillium angulare TaxID=116970 RepID=UPI0025419F29|nr:uncharacterized protein N7478_003865 [Penicillium angulare]KAJ5288179.1 hypothetical protein N7478_003865 [Penicillium angulare]
MLFSIYPIVFQQNRGWNAGDGELPLIETVIGACLGGLGLFINTQIERKKQAQNGTVVPENRLPGAMVGGVMFAVTIFWFAWTAEYNSVHWAVPTVAGTFLATSILLIFNAFINYIIDSYLIDAASAVAANTIVRSACAAASPLFTQYMFDGLGIGGAGSLIEVLGLLLLPTLVAHILDCSFLTAHSSVSTLSVPLPYCNYGPGRFNYYPVSTARAYTRRASPSLEHPCYLHILWTLLGSSRNLFEYTQKRRRLIHYGSIIELVNLEELKSPFSP